MADDLDFGADLLGMPGRAQSSFGTDLLQGVEEIKPNTALPNIKVSRDTNPDEFAKQKGIATKIGVAPEAVAAAPKEAAAIAEDAFASEVLNVSPATHRFYENADNARLAHDVVGELSTIERIVRGYQRGEVTSELGRVGFQLRNAPQSDVLLSRTAGLQERMKQLGQDDEGFVSALAGVAEFFGQRVSSFRQPRVAGMTAAGGATGAAAGTAGGPFAPITVPAGTAGGLASGFVASQIMDVGEIEAGLSYVEQLEAGVDKDVAYWTSLGVGVINAGLESLGGASFLKPLSESGKQAFREGMRKVVRNPELAQAATRFAANYGGNIAVETATEVAQEVVNIAAEEIGKSMTDGKAAEWTPDEWAERLSQIAIKTMKTTALLGAPGSSYAAFKDIREARKAQATLTTLDETQQALSSSKLAARSPETAAEHAAEAFREQGVDGIYVPYEALAAVAAKSGDPQKFMADLGVQDQFDRAAAFNGDIRIDNKAFVEKVMLSDSYGELKEHVKLGPEEISAAEAKERSKLPELDEAADEVSRDTSAPTEDAQAVALAEHEAGLAALFKDGNEAGLTEKQYASYIAAIQGMKDATLKAKERLRLKRELKKNATDYKAAEVEVRQSVAESLTNDPHYQALLAIGRDRLDRKAVLELLQGDEASLEKLPKSNGQRIYTQKGEKGVDPRVFADLYGFDGADIMLFQFMDKPGFDEAVSRDTTAAMEQRFPTMLDQRGQIEEALRALHEPVNYGDVLTFELNRMREARGQGRIKQGLIKAKALEALEGYGHSEINIRQLEATQRREAERARKAVREGDLEEAARAKLNQTVAFHMAREAYKVKDEVAKGEKYLGRFVKGKISEKVGALPVDSLNAIRSLLKDHGFGQQDQVEPVKLQEFIDRKLREDGVVVQVPEQAFGMEGKPYDKLTLSEWRTLRDTVQAIQEQGLAENKLLREGEKATRLEIVNNIINEIDTNLKTRTRPASSLEPGATAVRDVPWWETQFQRVKEAKDKLGIDLSTILLNTDSILRHIDGWRDLGPAYEYIKGGIDKALYSGYREGSVGYIARMRSVSADLVKLFDMYSKQERAGLDRQQDIPGVRARLTKREQLGVLLNLGNADNIKALLEGRVQGQPQFYESELRAILDNASKRDLDFVQSVWDYYEKFWPEIKQTVERRQGRNVEKVEATALETKHGNYRGGYFPLIGDNERGVLESQRSVEDAKQLLLSGGLIAAHTRNDFTKTRVGFGGRPVLLDPTVIFRHMQQIVYDLEVGDAIIDTYKVLHHKGLKTAFVDAGHRSTWEALDTWLGDVTTGEIHRSGIVETSLRKLRTGSTIAAMGFNVGVAMLQPLGILQSAVQVGKAPIASALWDFVASPLKNGGDVKAPYKLATWISEQSALMREREGMFNKDIVEAQRGLREGLLSRILPGNAGDHLGEAMFLFTTKAQRVADLVTWLGAYKRGLKDFENDHDKSVEFADRMVVRAQGSGMLHERTPFERGTISKNIRQTEMVKVWSLFISYFAAKLNVAYEQTKNTDFANPVKVFNYATDMALLFMVEGLISAFIRNSFSLDEDGDDEDDVGKIALREATNGLVAGIPLVREVATAANGFPTGGAVGSFASKVTKAAQQVSDGEVDAAAAKAILNVMGPLFRFPSSQINKTGDAIYQNEEGYDVEPLHYLMGVPHTKK